MNTVPRITVVRGTAVASTAGPRASVILGTVFDGVYRSRKITLSLPLKNEVELLFFDIGISSIIVRERDDI